jgi:hypothetical protein
MTTKDGSVRALLQPPARMPVLRIHQPHRVRAADVRLERDLPPKPPRCAGFTYQAVGFAAGL